MRDLHIATGRSRFSKSWKNASISWPDLLERLQAPTRTQESYKEYKSLSKAQQGELKDVGGFVAGVLKGGRRKSEAVESRSIITLDLDNLKESAESFWDGFCMFQDMEAALYSTHSHGPKHTRLRLLVPLSRDVSPDEYEAVARSFAADVGLDGFDPTTFEPARLMYWPSCPRDAQYIYKVQKGAWLDPDTFLSALGDWKDTSKWPGLDKFEARVLGDVKRQEDPLEKKGIIGAYCRSYPITELLEGPLGHLYTKAGGGRYTYTGGTTAGGLVVYEDRFAYSHHATDPICGKLVNAFDLMRLHLFGGLDDEANENTPVHRLPSFLKMEAMASEDEKTKLLYFQELEEDAAEGFEFEDDEDRWTLGLDMDKNKVMSTIHNCRLIIENEKRIKGRIRYDAFKNRASVLEELPWQEGKDRDWNDADDAGCRQFLEKQYKISGVQKIKDGITLAFESCKVHPVKEYLESLTWDGKERLESALIDYLGAADTPYTRAVTKIHLTASVARIFRPGTKYDNMLVLIGKQGLGKSTFIRLLASEAWYCDSIDRINGKETFEMLQGHWHIELGELNATRKAEKEAVKQFLSKTDDIYRAPYGMRTQRYPRQCVFWGTGNEVEFLRDETGERRYFPVSCAEQNAIKSVFRDLPKERDQLWAEAVECFKAGTSLFLSGELEEEAVKVRERHKEDRPKVGMVREFLDTPIPLDWYKKDIADRAIWIRGSIEKDVFEFDDLDLMMRDKVCIAEIWCELFEKKKGDIRPIDSKEIGDIMRELSDEWEPTENSIQFSKYGKQRGYLRAKK